MSNDRAALPTADAAVKYALAGNARLTLLSKATGVRFTYRVRAKDSVFFVAVLTGSDNESDYTFLGTIFNSRNYRHGRKSSIGYDAPSEKAFAYFWDHAKLGTLPASLEVWHEGACGRCGRPLTDPESIARGIGPVCLEGGA